MQWMLVMEKDAYVLLPSKSQAVQFVWQHRRIQNEQEDRSFVNKGKWYLD